MASDPTFIHDTGSISASTDIPTLTDLGSGLRYLRVTASVSGNHTITINGGSNTHTIDGTTPWILDMTHMDNRFDDDLLVQTVTIVPASAATFTLEGHS